MKQNATLDSSFWINAHRSGLLPNVLELFAIHYAPAVALELRETFPSGREFWRLAQEGQVTEAVPKLEVFRSFGPGERGAINLALEHRDWTLLMDDRTPFVESVRLGLKALCTPVLVAQLFVEGALDAPTALEALARLAAMQTLSPDLLALALAQIGKARKEKGE
ncbi:MAG: hypothetical protein HY681_02805 [Chloroflexi bacterium]|nr:hypothetical protein [Chloroflexota bacterium]